MTALPDLDIARVRRYVEQRNADIPFDARVPVRCELDVAPTSLTIMECRPPWREGYWSTCEACWWPTRGSLRQAARAPRAP